MPLVHIIFVSPAKHGRHIGIMTPVASSLSALSHFWFPIDSSWRDSSISFKLYRRVTGQVRKGGGDNPQSFDWVMAFFTQILAKLWFPIYNFWKDATISFKYYRMVKIQVSFEFGGHSQTFYWAMALIWFRFRLIQKLYNFSIYAMITQCL